MAQHSPQYPCGSSWYNTHLNTLAVHHGTTHLNTLAVHHGTTLTSMPSRFMMALSIFRMAALIVFGGGSTVRPMLITLDRLASSTASSFLVDSAFCIAANQPHNSIPQALNQSVAMRSLPCPNCREFYSIPCSISSCTGNLYCCGRYLLTSGAWWHGHIALLTYLLTHFYSTHVRSLSTVMSSLISPTGTHIWYSHLAPANYVSCLH